MTCSSSAGQIVKPPETIMFIDAVDDMEKAVRIDPADIAGEHPPAA